VHYSAAPRSPGKDFSGVPRTHQFLVTLMVHTNKTNATTAPTTASPTSVTDTDSVVAIPRDGQHLIGTGMRAVNSVAAVCQAPTGIVSSFEDLPHVRGFMHT